MKKIFIAPIMALVLSIFAPTSVAMGEERGEKSYESLNIQPSPDADILRSASNARGEKILAYRAKGVPNEEGQPSADILAIQSKNGKISPLIEFELFYGARNIVPLVVLQILWLDDDHFACVGAGRRRSPYAVYRIMGESSDFPGLVEAMTLAEGVIRYRVKWFVQGGELKAKDVYDGKLIFSMSY